MSSRFGALEARKSGIVRGVRGGLLRKSTGHSVMRRFRTCTYCCGAGSSMYSS
jgi:hypothetical protein